MSAAGHLRLLLRARWRMARNLTLTRAAPARALGVAALAALPALAAGAGWALAPALARAAQRPLAPGQLAPAGGPWVELGFWLSVLAAMVLSFRVMENLYRAQDARLLSSWPIALADLFLYRLLMSAAEVAAALGLGAPFFLALWLRAHDPRALAALALFAASALTSLALGFAVQLYAGVLNFTGARPDRSPLQSVAVRDAGGGVAAAFLFSPAAGMLGSIALILLMKLACADELFARGATRLFWVGAGISAGAGVVSLALARRWFVAHYPALLARFYESDLLQFDSGYKYHQSAASRPTGPIERALPARLLPHYRKDSLQLARRHPLLRGLALALWVAVGVMSWGGASRPWLVALLPLLVTAALAAPAARLLHEELAPAALRLLPAHERDAALARLWVAGREALVAGLPCGLIIAALGGGLPQAAAAALAPALLTPALLWAAQRLGPGAARALGAALGAALLLLTLGDLLP